MVGSPISGNLMSCSDLALGTFRTSGRGRKRHLVNMNKYTYDVGSFSDLHKDARGFRPREGFWQWMNNATPDELQEKWDSLIEELNQSIAEEKAMEERCLVLFKEDLARLTAAYNIPVSEAIEMMHQINGTRGDNESLDYQYGVAFGTIAKILKGEGV